MEQRLTARVLALVSLAVCAGEEGDPAAARAAAEHAIATAADLGLAAYHGIAPAFAVRARAAADVDQMRVDAAHAVQLARRATTELGLALVLATCADALLDAGDEAGAALLADARDVVGRCIDPGIAGRVLARVESRHRRAPAPPAGAVALVEPLTEREIALLRYLPTALSLREIAAELYVSLNTVKTHCSALYRKLGVGDRKSAVQAGRDLGAL